MEIQYERDDPETNTDEYASRLGNTLQSPLMGTGLRLPLLTIRARPIDRRSGGRGGLPGLAPIQDIPGVRRYVSVDGGMADNIRTALYGARYHAEIANRVRWSGDGRDTRR